VVLSIDKTDPVFIILWFTMEKERIFDSRSANNSKKNQIMMSFNNGNNYKTPTTLLKAIEIVIILPTSLELENNFTKFKNQNNEVIIFHRIFNDLWDMELIIPQKDVNQLSLEYKYLTSNAVFMIVINFFYDNFIGDLISLNNDKNNQYKELVHIIKKIKEIIEKNSICLYCNNRIKSLGENKCNYCGTTLNFNLFFFSNLKNNSLEEL